MPAILPTTMPALLGSFPLPFQKFLWKVRDMIKSAVRLSVQDKIYLLGRDGEETRRLNDQHRFLVAVSGHTIHPSIPKENITAIADLGTGTGVWLEDVAKTLPKSVYLHGFDISAAQIPIREGPIALSVHDVLYPFPEEHQSRYDLVHIRLLTAGLKKKDYAIVLANARALLKPNGYIQWEELDHSAFCTDAVPEADVVNQMRQSVTNAMLSLDLCPTAPQRVYEDILAGGFADVITGTHTTKGKDHLRDISQRWVAGVMRALVTPSMLVTGEAKTEFQAREKVNALVAKFDDHCQHAKAMVNLGVTVGRKV
ncbi:Methyltransferase type 12 [Penicillium brevicompactum]|uniref:Methyltransferase type 12 n=1 Tax=Penicillium brevicompactum TaxID=5074 RepID=A0A9W9QB89_PENBR|nr:Methyltransferase type 12 [Penicillium brevicompactum]